MTGRRGNKQGANVSRQQHHKQYGEEEEVEEEVEEERAIIFEGDHTQQ